jgi:hypothetical protein
MKTTRVGLTSNDIDFLRSIYHREPNGLGSSTLDDMKRSFTPDISARMGEDIHNALSDEAVAGSRVKRLPQRIRCRTPPREKRLVGGRLVEEHPSYDEHLLDPEPVFSTSRSQLAETGRSISNAQVEKILTARTQRTQRTNRTNCTNRTQRTQRISSARIQSETARLQASKEELQNQLFAISSKLKTAMTKPEPDQPLTVESINADSMLTKYDRDAGYRCFNRNRYSTQTRIEFPQECFDRPFTPKTFRKFTEHGQYAKDMAKYKNSLCDRQYSTW